MIVGHADSLIANTLTVTGNTELASANANSVVAVSMNTTTLQATSINSTSMNSVSMNANSMVLGVANLSANGHATLPNGLTLQWGLLAANTTVGNATFQVPYSVGPFSYQASSGLEFCWIPAVNTTVIQIRSANATTGAAVSWMTVGT